MKYIIILFLISTYASASQLENFCESNNGKIFDWYKCPKSKLPLKIKTCEYKNSYGVCEWLLRSNRWA